MENKETVAVRPNKTIYREGAVLTKVFDHTKMPKPAVLKEAFIHALVENTALNIPKVLQVHAIGLDWAIATEYVEGPTLAVLMARASGAARQTLWDRFVALQRQVLAQSAPGLPDMKDKFNARISALGRVADPARRIEATIRYELHVALDRMPSHTKLCHGDFLPENIIVAADGREFVLDWSHATLGNGAADAAHTYLSLYLTGRRTEAAYYLKAYAKATDTAEQYIRSWFPVVSAGMLLQAETPADIAFLTKQIQLIEFQ